MTLFSRVRRRLGLVLAGAALMPALVAVAQAQVPAATSVPKVIRIGVATGGVGTPPRTGGTTAGIANAQGLLEKEFEKDGIQVQWIFFKGAGPAVNEALVNRQLDLVWQGDLPSIVHRANGVKTRILLGNGVRTGLYLGVTPESGIQGIKDLKGKRIAVFKGTNLHLAAVRALAAHGLKESDVKLINLDFAASQAALTTKDIDGFFGYVQLFALRDKGLAKIVWSAAQDSYRFTRQTVLLGTDEFIEKHPQAVQRVVDVLVRTTRQYSEESRRADLFEEWGKAEYPAAVWREDFVGQPLRVRLSPLLDPFLVDIYKQAAKQAHELKLVRSVPEIDSWFDRRFLDAALKSQGLVDYWPAYGADGNLIGGGAGVPVVKPKGR
ncbi:MAG: ABC transporter substrate-binding protein [Sphaerotilus natans subsp. sulfidivorans]|uniref:ABC transporter substrate-binding protein n=1 Tax=Sphaerotilus sulfidivorans TaxID=639200 RepID=UPI002356902E|nr:ABC transporter substrate-binding protein [Sphaerotilus sulfidivorans]MCK6403237.1 ABC transporter substrate-binding protein [Sphaerotilus sulfidivorans]